MKISHGKSGNEAVKTDKFWFTKSTKDTWKKQKKNWQKKRGMKNSMPRIYTLQNLSEDWKILNLGMTNYEKDLTACLEIHWITLNSGLQNIIFKEVLGKVLVCQPFPPSLWTHDAVYLLYVPKCMKWDKSFKNTWPALKSDTACTYKCRHT